MFTPTLMVVLDVASKCEKDISWRHVAAAIVRERRVNVEVLNPMLTFFWQCGQLSHDSSHYGERPPESRFRQSAFYYNVVARDHFALCVFRASGIHHTAQKIGFLPKN